MSYNFNTISKAWKTTFPIKLIHDRLHAIEAETFEAIAFGANSLERLPKERIPLKRISFERIPLKRTVTTEAADV